MTKRLTLKITSRRGDSRIAPTIFMFRGVEGNRDLGFPTMLKLGA